MSALPSSTGTRAAATRCSLATVKWNEEQTADEERVRTHEQRPLVVRVQPHHTPFQLDRPKWVPEQLNAPREIAVGGQLQQNAREELRVAPVLGVQAEQRRVAGRRLDAEHG